ncbi:MAG: restriction endonuclease [Acidimicrobiales bacterium]
MTDAADRGRELEARVAAHFAAHGYVCRSNAVLRGRSGASHEVDVLAEKVDSLTSYRVAVECKAWSVPVDQDVVSKLAWVVADLGLHKGIVVSLAGAGSGAAQAAEGLGIELWAGEEIGRRLAQAPPAPSVVVLGQPAVVGPDRAARTARRARAGRSGRSREAVVASDLAWLPVHELALAVAARGVQEVRGARARRPARSGPGEGRVAVSRVWNLYEALSGSYLGATADPEPWAELEVGAVAIPPLVRSSQLVAELRRTTTRLARVATEAAVARHRAALGSLGVGVEGGRDLQEVDIEGTRLVHLPYHLCLLEGRDGERVVAVDARTGALAPVVADAATAKLRHVAEALAWPR